MVGLDCDMIKPMALLKAETAEVYKSTKFVLKINLQSYIYGAIDVTNTRNIEMSPYIRLDIIFTYITDVKYLRRYTSIDVIPNL